MGTRSTTFVYEEEGHYPLLCMFRQYDGYPEGHGKQLAEFLNGVQLVNGLKINEPPKVANGMDCLAAQLVAHFKVKPGNIYIQALQDTGGEDYRYHVFPAGDGTVRINVDTGGEQDTKFEGSPEEFLTKYLPRRLEEQE